MTIYKISTSDGVMYLSANLADASAPIHTYFGDDPRYDERGEAVDDTGGGWNPTPYQTADCQHREGRMAKLLADYCEMGEIIKVEEMP